MTAAPDAAASAALESYYTDTPVYQGTRWLYILLSTPTEYQLYTRGQSDSRYVGK